MAEASAPATEAPKASSWGGGLFGNFDKAAWQKNIDSLSKKALETAEKAQAGVQAAAAAAAESAQSAAEKLQAPGKLQQTVQEFLVLSGSAPPPTATVEELAQALQERGLKLVKQAESYRSQCEQAMEKGKVYKASWKAESERAEKAVAAGRALHAQHATALRRIQQLEAQLAAAGVLVPEMAAVDGAPEGAAAPPATPAAEARLGEAAAFDIAEIAPMSTPAFLHEAEHDLQRHGEEASVDVGEAASERGEGIPHTSGAIELTILPCGTQSVLLRIGSSAAHGAQRD